jgi:mannosyltransferase
MTSDRSILGGILLVAYLLASHALTRSSFWLDEGVTGRLAHIPFRDFVHNIFGREVNAGFYFALVRLWQHVESGDGGARRVSVFAFVATVFLVHLLGREIFGPRAGLIAAAVFTVQPFVVHYAQEARGYMLATAISAAAMYCLLRAVSSNSFRWWFAWSGTACAACWSHFYSVFVVLAALASIVFAPRALRARLLVFGIPPVVFTLTLSYLGSRAGGGRLSSFVSTPDAAALIRTGESLAGSRPLAWIWLAFLFAGLVTTIVRWKRRWSGRWRLSLVPLWAGTPPLLALLVSLTSKPILVDRYLLVILPAGALLAGAALDKVAGPIPLAVFVLVCIGPLGMNYRPDKPDWRTATSFILANSAAADGLAFTLDYERIPFDYYAQRLSPIEHPTPVAPAVPIASRQIQDFPRPADSAEALDGHRRVWLVSFRDPQSSLRPFLQRLNRDYVQVGHWDFKGIPMTLWQSRTG